MISLSFANIKEKDYKTTVYRICQILMVLYEKYGFLRKSELLSNAERDYFDRMASAMSEEEAPRIIPVVKFFKQALWQKGHYPVR